MKLKQSKPNKISPKQLLKQRRNFAETIQQELELKGVDFFEPSENGSLNIDTEYLMLPYSITEISGKELGEYLNAYTQQKMYMRTMIGWAECYVEEAKRDYYEASDDKYRELSKTKLSETAKEREINSDPDILPYYEEYQNAKKKLQLLNLNIYSIEDAIFLISREVSRRTGDFNNENRAHNVSRI